MGIKILHLSDLHISSKEDNNFRILRDGILKYVKEKKWRLILLPLREIL